MPAAYSQILHHQQAIQRHVYIDAFAGAGKHISKATREFVAGSPVNALLVEPGFTEFHFIDLNRERVKALNELAGERPNVMVHEGDCNDILLNTVFPRCRYEDFARTLFARPVRHKRRLAGVGKCGAYENNRGVL